MPITHLLEVPKPSAEAVELARRTPWTADFAERVLEAHRELGPVVGVDLDTFVDAVMRCGLGPLRLALTPSTDEASASFTTVSLADHGEHVHFREGDRLGPAIPNNAGAIARALERRGE